MLLVSSVKKEVVFVTEVPEVRGVLQVTTLMLFWEW